jgi:ADP-ribosylglycohydrolase
VRGGGDSDSLACITGGIAEAFYGPVSPTIRQKVQKILTPELREITEAFCGKFGL